jgi:multimeric flavodoxin WrbA
MEDKTPVKKVLIILGSPRKNGNSAILAERVAEGARAQGAEVETVFLQGLQIAPCKSCYACQKKGAVGCATQDDMQALYPKLIEAEAWVIASPVYWFTMSAQTKIFMDRLFALPACAPNPFAGKRIAVAMTYGDTDPFTSGCINALRTFQDAFRYTGSRLVGMVYGSALEAGAIRANEPLLQQAEALGRRLIKK